ncbi:hypothetical protein [Paracidobacterium acidisoli]|uniref:hypothetical protein n=1 Tax=Paracidobacterium acidisoli TaxID=2303751 RepID=UPI000E3BA6AF|nr:hypothetical protein [Paracidobacterium acidisoli]MBT9332006.1 hypothetical protein [Paracidobacterium acidisoli]
MNEIAPKLGAKFTNEGRYAESAHPLRILQCAKGEPTSTFKTWTCISVASQVRFAMVQRATEQNYADGRSRAVADAASFALQKGRRHGPKTIDPEIAICGKGVGDGDAAIKGFIDDWFVPTLVEAYIRERQEQSKPR